MSPVPSRLGRLLAVVTVALVPLLAGCKQFIMLGYLIGGPPSIAPEFDEATGKSFTDFETTVAVVCYAPDDLKFDFHDIDQELAKYVSFRLVEHKIQVVDPVRINDWLDRNDDWDSPAEIGAEFDVDYVVYIDLVKYNLYERSSQTLYRGRSEAFVSVIEMDDDGSGEEIFEKDVLSTYPTRVGRPTTEVSYQTFKAEYLSHLSDRIGQLFYGYYLADQIGNAS